jgi:hypothetical protein
MLLWIISAYKCSCESSQPLNKKNIIIIFIINFKLRAGFHPVAVTLQNDTQIKHITAERVFHINEQFEVFLEGASNLATGHN